MVKKDKLLHSKVEIPELQRNLVIRERLLKEIHNTSEKMVILYGTVGYGKTVLMSHYVRLYESPCAWYHLDEMDNDLYTFFEYLTAAVRQVRKDFSFDLEGYVRQEEGLKIDRKLGMRFVIALNEFLGSEEFFRKKLILVLDDFQSVRNEEIYSFVHLLTEYGAENLRIFIATKSSLPAFAAALLLRERAKVIEMDALAFNEQEVETVLERITGQSMSLQNVQTIYKKMEGWPAGTMFAAQYLKQTGQMRQKLDWDVISEEALIQNYIMNELYRKLPFDIQQFLVKTSVLDEISVELCNYVLKITNARSTLNYLLQENLFILRINKGTGYYRYHSIFKMFLQKLLMQQQKEEIFRRTAEYYLRVGNQERAVEYYIRYDDFVNIEKCFLRYGRILAEQKQVQSLKRWMDYISHTKDHVLSPEGKQLYEELEGVLRQGSSCRKEAQINIQCFGGFHVFLGKEKHEMSWRTKKAAELFACLVQRQGKAITRNELLTLLWPEDYPANAVAMLHNMFYNIRKELSPFGLNQLIQYSNKEYRMAMEAIDTDIQPVQRVCAAVEVEDMIYLTENEEMFQTYWGVWLEGIDNGWCMEARYYYEKCFLDGCRLLGRNYIRKGLYSNAAAVLRAGLEVDSYSEEMAVLLMQSYSHLQMRKEGKKLYEHICQIYRTDLGVKPGSDFVKAYEGCIHGWELL